MAPYTRWLVVIAIALMAGSMPSRAQSIRLFFDPVGAGEMENRPATPLSYTNPSVAAHGNGSARLYLYAEMAEPMQLWDNISVNLRVTGAGEITGWHFYNRIIPVGGATLIPRWTALQNQMATGVSTQFAPWIGSVSFGCPHLGVRNGSPQDPLHDRLPAQDGSPFGTVLLGFVDVRHTGGTNPAQLRLETGPQGTVPSNGNFTFGIQFGYNDAMVPAAAANATSAIADAFILPPIVGADHTEIEPNNTKLRATPVIPIQSGQRLRGRTTGNLAGAGEASADYWLIGSPPEDFVRIYRHRLALESTTPGHTLTMRGHLQGNGFIDRGSDATIATAVASTNPPRHIDWYSFGRREMAYFRVVGTSTTTSHYDLLYSRTPVTPVSLGSFVEGTITISTHGQGHSTDTDLWLYDAHLQAIPLAGNQHTPLGNRATLTRLLAPGVYYLALSTSNLANDQGQPADDALPFDPVTDFPGIVLNSTTSTGQNLAFAITDANRTATFAASHSEPFLVYWGQFQVLPGCGVDFNGDLNIDPDDLADYIAAYFGGC